MRPSTRDGLTLFALLALAAPALALSDDEPGKGLIPIPPQVFWIGPEDACDYPTIQEAIDDVFCILCPAFNIQFRLSPNYAHSGQIQIRKSLSILGGFTGCGGTFNGVRKLLSPGVPGQLIGMIAPENGSITVTLSHLNLFGPVQTQPTGGVILMAGGSARLILDDVAVTRGRAQKGGGISMLGEGKVLELIDADIVDNDAFEGDFFPGVGGGIHCEGGGTILFKSGTVRENSAVLRGGGIHLEGCRLLGTFPNMHRSIVDNRVTRNSFLGFGRPGKGGGVYAGGADALVELGAVRSRTLFEGNVVSPWVTTDTISVSRAHGGGLHLQRSAAAVLRNVQFVENRAPSGAGVSLESGAILDMDRTSGPCAVSRASACSAFIGNVTTGQSPSVGAFDRGEGSAIFRRGGGPIFLRRTELRENESNGSEAKGSLISVQAATLNEQACAEPQPTVLLDGNLVFINTIADGFPGRFLNMSCGPDDLRVLRNTVAFNPFDGNAETVLRIDPPGEPAQVRGELIANVFWDPNTNNPIVGASSARAAVSACNVSHRTIPAVAAALNEVGEDPLFVDSSVGTFRVLADSPAVNRCDNAVGIGWLEPTYDIVGRARPSSDGFGTVGGGRTYDAGALEYHAGAPNEIDLAVTVRKVNDSGTLGATFEVVVQNVGLTTAQPGNFDVLFPRPPRAFTLEGWDSCEEETAGSTVQIRCSKNIPTGLSTLLSTVPLRISMAPDSAAECTLTVRTDPGDQPDTNSTNDVASSLVVCGDPDLIFDTGFETGDTSEWSSSVGMP